MPSFLRPLTTPVTYTRWLHLLLPGAAVSVWLFISTDTPWVPVVLAALVGLIPGVRLAEGIQAQLLLTPEERGNPAASISVAPPPRGPSGGGHLSGWRSACSVPR